MLFQPSPVEQATEAFLQAIMPERSVEFILLLAILNNFSYSLAAPMKYVYISCLNIVF